MTPQDTAFLRVTPLLPAGDDLAAALAFYTDQLGFAVSWQTGGMAGIFRGEVGFSLVRNGNRIWADNCSRGIGVADPDRLYQAYRGADAIIGELETKPWGRREFHMIVPSGVCLQFYEAGV